MSEAPEMLAYVESLRFEAMAKYVQGGRILVRQEDEQLRRRWVDLFREWVSNFQFGHDHREREDVESELQLRGLLPPFDRVTEELAAMRKKSGAHIEALLRDPERALRMEQRLNAELDAYRSQIKTAN
jgi:hypothetical protein